MKKENKVLERERKSQGKAINDVGEAFWVSW